MEEIARQSEIVEPPVMEVDWDEIDKHDHSYPVSPTGNFRYSPGLSEDTLTVSDNRSDIYAPSPMSIQQGLEFQRPNAVEDEIMSTPSLMKLQKPDGGF